MPRIRNVSPLPSNHTEPLVVKLSEFAAMLGLDNSTARHACLKGELWGKPFPPFFRKGKRDRMFFMKDVHAFLAQFDLHASNATEDEKPFNPFAKKS